MTYQTPEVLEVGRVEEIVQGPLEIGEILDTDLVTFVYPE